jgi:hypothetical protein
MNYYAAAGIALVALLIGACGGSGLKKTDISDIAANFYRALSDDPPKAYTYLSQDCRSKIGYLDFVSTINTYHGFAGQGELKVKNVKIVDETSSHVTADYDVVLVSEDDEIPLTGQLDLPGPSKFVKENGRWRFEDCAGFPAGGSDAISTPETTKTPAAGATPTFEPGSAPAIEGDNDPSLPGEFVDLQKIYGGFWGNQNGTNTARHMQQIIDYSVQGELPPAGGPHWGGRCPDDPDAAPLYCGPVPWGVYRKPWPAESVVHNMEHAGVIIWYNTSDQNVISQIEALARKNIAGGKLIVVTPYPAMETDYVALTAWGRRDKFPISDYSDERPQEFIDKLECRFDPERLCPEAPAPTPLSGGAL